MKLPKFNKNAVHSLIFWGGTIIVAIFFSIGMYNLHSLYVGVNKNAAEYQHYKDSVTLENRNHAYSIISKQNGKWVKIDCHHKKWKGQGATKKLVLYAADSSHIYTFETNLSNILTIPNK